MGLPASRRRNYGVTSAGRRYRLPDVPGVSHERAWWAEGGVVAGVDEVGRGAWAGPVTYAAVVLPSHRRMYKLRDSKLLDPVRREELAARLWGFAAGIGLGQASNEEIDAWGLSLAMRTAARRAADALPVVVDGLLLDGNWDFLADHPARRQRLVHGDARSASIAAASIVAKVTRDRLMASEVDPAFPRYGFASNKGYPSPAHRAILQQHGPCAAHRRTWSPVAAAATPA